MKTFLLYFVFAIFPLTSVRAEDESPNDQLLVIFGASGYVLYKVLDFANDHGFRYCKILSYEFQAFDHVISGNSKWSGEDEGRFFELKDGLLSVSFICFDELPNDPFIIDLEKYRPFVENEES